MRISDNITTPYNKEELYKDVVPQARSLVSGGTDLIANMANPAIGHIACSSESRRVII